MEFTFSDVQLSWQAKGRSLGGDLAAGASAADVIMAAARVGLIDTGADLLAAALAIESLAQASAGAAVTLAVHTSALLAIGADERFTALARGEIVGAIAMSSEQVATEQGSRLSGRALWVGPATDRGLAIVGARAGGPDSIDLVATAVALDARGVASEFIATAGLSGFRCAHVSFSDAPCIVFGAPKAVMTRVRILLAAAGIGMGRRALAEALRAAHAYSRTGPGGEQTLQGLVADAATELDAASVLMWRAACSSPLSLAEASMAKLAAAEAAMRAVARASQVAGADAFRQGNILERLAQDVRALEVFAGRTEGLREAVAESL